MKIKVNNREFDGKITYNAEDRYYTIEVGQGKQVMGYVTFKTKRETRGNTIWINKIETYEQFAHRGVGTAVIQLLEYFAYKNNISYMEGKFYPDNEYAKPFYEKLGYTIEKEYYETFVYKLLDFKEIKTQIAPNITKYNLDEELENSL